ncbi:MAG: enoyl-CoA hydratase-related protein, partial [Beijerinckiaceae bacterium]
MDRHSAHAPPAAHDHLPVIRRDSGGITFLTLNEPERRNVLSQAMLVALKQHFAEIAGDRHVRAVVLDAVGPAFCAGHDLKEMTAHRAEADGGRAHFSEVMADCADMMQAIVMLPVPVIAAIEGVATAAGCQLVASCDLAIAGAQARFCTPGVNIGLFCSTPMVALSRNVARKHAMEMLLTGDMI